MQRMNEFSGMQLNVQNLQLSMLSWILNSPKDPNSRAKFVISMAKVLVFFFVIYFQGPEFNAFQQQAV